MKRFEYKVLPVNMDAKKDELHKELNELGKEGWELVSATEFSKAGWLQGLYEASLTSGFAFFKKRTGE